MNNPRKQLTGILVLKPTSLVVIVVVLLFCFVLFCFCMQIKKLLISIHQRFPLKGLK